VVGGHRGDERAGVLIGVGVRLGDWGARAEGEQLFLGAEMFERVEAELGTGPWFAGERFSLVDAVYGPILRYFDVFDAIGDFGALADKPKLAAWRGSLAKRETVRNAVSDDYPERLLSFLENRGSAISVRIASDAPHIMMPPPAEMASPVT